MNLKFYKKNKKSIESIHGSIRCIQNKFNELINLFIIDSIWYGDVNVS